jgi:hypothetical protein
MNATHTQSDKHRHEPPLDAARHPAAARLTEVKTANRKFARLVCRQINRPNFVVNHDVQQTDAT